MMVLITGGSGSGKSAYAEEYTGILSKNCKKFYIATMQVFDQEGQNKVQRHRIKRAGKGFVTIEQPVEIEKVIDKMRMEKGIENTALLECMSNLTANEMFSEETPQGHEAVTEKIIRGIEIVNKEFTHLVIVTNNVFEDGIIYDETTMEYIRAMGSINKQLAKMADMVIEVVVGIPVILKEGK